MQLPGNKGKSNMTLTNKIVLLVAFMILSSGAVFYWFTQRLFQHIGNFQQSMTTQREYLEARQKEQIADLHHKREKLLQEVSTHLNQMESALGKNQERVEELNKEFQTEQNDVFDAIDDFNAGNTHAP
jgi:uncharacterized protein HemX